MERNPAKQPKNWSLEECVRFLYDPANKQGARPVPAGTGAGEAEAAGEEDEAEGEQHQRVRWSRSFLIRLFHVISSLPREFMLRNRKLSRQELDANSKDFFWEKAGLQQRPGLQPHQATLCQHQDQV